MGIMADYWKKQKESESKKEKTVKTDNDYKGGVMADYWKKQEGSKKKEEKAKTSGEYKGGIMADYWNRQRSPEYISSQLDAFYSDYNNKYVTGVNSRSGSGDYNGVRKLTDDYAARTQALIRLVEDSNLDGGQKKDVLGRLGEIDTGIKDNAQWATDAKKAAGIQRRLNDEYTKQWNLQRIPEEAATRQQAAGQVLDVVSALNPSGNGYFKVGNSRIPEEAATPYYAEAVKYAGSKKIDKDRAGRLVLGQEAPASDDDIDVLTNFYAAREKYYREKAYAAGEKTPARNFDDFMGPADESATPGYRTYKTLERMYGKEAGKSTEAKQAAENQRILIRRKKEAEELEAYAAGAVGTPEFEEKSKVDAGTGAPSNSDVFDPYYYVNDQLSGLGNWEYDFGDYQNWKNLDEETKAKYNYIHNTKGYREANKYLEYVSPHEYTATQSIMSGTVSPFIKIVGAFAPNWYREYKVIEDSKAQENSTSYKIGNIAGTLALYYSLGAAVGPAAEAVGLGSAATSAISYGLGSAVTNLADLRAGFISGGQYFGNVATSAASGALAGELMGKAGKLANKFEGYVYSKYPKLIGGKGTILVNQLKDVFIHEAGALGRQTVDSLVNGKIDTDALFSDMLVSAIFGVIKGTKNGMAFNNWLDKETGELFARNIKPVRDETISSLNTLANEWQYLTGAEKAQYLNDTLTKLYQYEALLKTVKFPDKYKGTGREDIAAELSQVTELIGAFENVSGAMERGEPVDSTGTYVNDIKLITGAVGAGDMSAVNAAAQAYDEMKAAQASGDSAEYVRAQQEFNAAVAELQGNVPANATEEYKSAVEALGALTGEQAAPGSSPISLSNTDTLKAIAMEAAGVKKPETSIKPIKAETIIDTNPETHTKAENEVIDDYVNSVDDSLVSFYQETKADGFKTTKRHEIGTVSDRQAEDIQRETGIDVHGFSNAINNVGAEHIEIRHGENGKADQSMANIEDVGRIGYVLDNYDNAEAIKDSDGNVKLTGAYSDRNMKAVPMVKFSKKVNGTFYVVEAIPDSSYKKIWVQSAYIQKQDPRTRFTADNQSASAPRSADPVKESISETVQKSNIKSVLSSMPGADKVDAESMKAFVDAYDGSINPETYAQGMIWGWHAGNTGSTVEYARSNKAFASLPAKLQAQAHYAGENYGSNTIEGIEKQLDILMDTQARLPDSDAEAIDRFEEKITALRSKLKQLKGGSEVREEAGYTPGSKEYLNQKVRDRQLTLDEYAASIDSQKVKAERKRTAQALSELRAAASEIKVGDNVKTVALGIVDNFIEKGAVDYDKVKLDAKHPEIAASQIAAYGMILRDPRYETFRVFFVKGERIVGVDSFSSRLVDRVYITNEIKQGIKDKMTAYGAAGYYLMHNHPSGDPSPSGNDAVVTRKLSAAVPGMRGHIVIDHNKYTYLNAAGYAQGGVLDIPGEKAENFEKRIVDHPLLYEKFNDPSRLAQAAVDLVHSKDISAIMYCDNQGSLRAIEEVRSGYLRSKDFERYLADRKTALGAGQTFLLVSDGIAFDDAAYDLKDLFMRNLFFDIVDKKGNSVFAGDSGLTVTVGGRVAEVNGANRSRLNYNPDGTKGEKAFAVKEEDAHDRLVNQTMTMSDAKRMIEMTFNANGIKSWYDGKYKNGEEWLAGEGAKEVAMYAENTENVVEQYINRLPEFDDLNDDWIDIEEIIDAYQAGTLTGKIKAPRREMELSKSTGKSDDRFYAPKSITVSVDTWNKASERLTDKNREDVLAARKDILIAAHGGDLSDTGIDSKTLNARLRSWSGYPAAARQISDKINAGVAIENRWTGIENSSFLSKVSITDDNIKSMVKSITGESSRYQRDYIGRTMLALDTHIDWSGLSFVFENKGVLESGSKGALGYYDNNKTEIHVGTRGYLNTVAHEMGHALDHKWTRDLIGGGVGSGLPLSENTLKASEISDPDTRLFYEHFKEFIESINRVSDIDSSYTQRGTEVFARFVARFVEWTDKTAGGHIYNENDHYKDRFTVKQFMDFAHLLQEKAKLDMAKAPVSENAAGATMTQRRIDELIKDSSAGSRADYAQKWITSISPTDFLNMTLGEKNQNREVFDNMPGDYGDTNNTRDYLGDLKSSRQTPYLGIDITTGEVIGHEGRHRMRALEKQGITSTQIAVSFYDSDGRMIKELNGYGNPLDTIGSLKIFNQRGTGQSTTLSDIMPLNEASREAVMGRYGREDGRISYQAFEKDGNGNGFWLVESHKDIFSGIKETYELKKAAYNYILNGEKGEEVSGIVDGQDLKFIRISAQEYVYGRQSQNLEEDSFRKKMRLAPSITDLVKNAEIHYDAPDKKNHKLFPDGFTNYQGRVGIDDTIFNYIVRIGKAKDGKIFYDLNLEVDGKVPRALRTSPIKVSTSGGRVSQYSSSVNPENDNSAVREEPNYFISTDDAAPDQELMEIKRQLGEAWREYRELAQELKETEKELAGARKEAEKQAARAERFKAQTRLTKEWHVRNAAINELAKEYISTDLIDEARLPKENIAEQIRAITENILNNKDYSLGRLRADARALAVLLNNNGNTAETEQAREEREQIQEILPHKTTLTIEKQHRPADFFKKGGDGAFLRAHGINIKFTEPGDRSGRSIDDFWAEMSSEGMYPWLFSPEIISTGDQLDALCGIVRMAYTPQSGTPENSDWQLTDADYDEYLDWKTAQVMTDVIAISNEDKNKPTFADKKKAEREKAVYMAKVVTRDAEAAKWKAKMEKLSDQARIKSQQALDRVRAQRDERIAAIKQHNQEMRQAASERRQESADRTKLLNVARRLAKVKTRDTARQYIDSLIGDLDLVSKGITKKSIEKLSDLRDWYDEQVETNPDFIPSEWTKKQLDRLSKKHIADLDIDEVRKLTDVLLNIEHTIRMEKQFLDDSVKISTYNAGLNSIDDIRASGGVKNQSSFKYGAAISLLRPKTLLAKVVGYKQDSPFYKIGYEKMAEGEAKMIAYQNDAEARFKKFWDDKKFVKFLTEEKITIGGLGENGTQTAVITPDMRCALYMHYQNEDNVRHIATGGVVVPDYDLLRAGKTEAAYNKGVRIKLTPTQLRAIVAKVTAPELEYIRAAINYYENVSKPAINEVSNRQVGYSIAKVDNYFRISTNRNFLKKDFGEMSNDGTVASMGFTKERIAGASNPIDLVSLTSQLNQDIGNHAKYVGLSIPVADFNRLLNMQVTGYEASIKEALSQMWGAPVDGYIEKMMADFQGRGRDETKLERVINKPLNKIRSNYAAATLTLNLGVMLIQAASYHTAAAVLGWAATLKGMAKMGPLSEYEVKMMYKYSPLQAYREKGFNSIEMGDIVSRKGKTPAVLQGIQKIDIMTTRKLFKACMYAVKAQGVKYDTPEFWEKVGKLHTEVIRATQPNYTAFERPDILRSNNAIIQALAMFKTQPMQNYNILYEALGNLRAKHRAYQNGGSKEEYIKAKKEFADSFSAIGVSTLVFAGINMLWALIRRKEDEYEDENGELTFGSVMKGLGIDSISSLSGMVPLGGEIAGMIEHGIDSIIEGFGGEAFFDQPEYDITAPALEMITNLKNGIEAISDLSIKSIFDFENTTPAQWEKNFFAFEKALENISQVGGVPMANIRKLAAAIFANVTEPALGEYEGRYITMRISQSVSKNKNEYAQLLFDAFENDKEAFKTLYDSMTTDEVFATDSKGAKEVIDEKLTGIITDKLKAGEITDAQAIKYLTDCVGMGTEKAEKKVSSIKTNRIKEDYLEGNITADQAKKELEENGSDNAAWKVDGWDYAEENGDLEGHTKANNLFSAYLSGDSKKIKEAKGYYKSDDAAVTALTGEIGDRYRAGTLNKTATEKYLKNWCKKDSEDIFWSLDRWDYMKQHKDSDDGYSKYIRFDKAVESGKGRTAAVEFYKSHGFKLTTLKSAVTSRFKDKYIEAGRPYAMREKLLDMYQAIAYVYGETDFNRYKRGASIDKWTND